MIAYFRPKTRKFQTVNKQSRTPQLPPHVRGCNGCGCKYSALGPGDITHPAALNCAECGKFWRWVGRIEAEDFRRRGLLMAIAPVQKPAQSVQLTLDLFGGGK